MIKYTEWRDYLEEEVKNGSIYLWGGQGEYRYMLTDKYIEKKETSSTNAKRVIRLRDKRIKEGYENFRAFDCSGLGVCKLLESGEIKSDMTSHGIYSKTTHIKKSDLKSGDMVFRMYTSGTNKGHVYHIGYVVNDLYVIHAKGRDVGVVKETLNQNGANWWNAFGRSSWIEEYKPYYDYKFHRNMKKGMKGEDIKNLQALLQDNGFNCGSIDGVFGKHTKNSVIACQKSHRLKADGIAGKNTITALGGVWQ